MVRPPKITREALEPLAHLGVAEVARRLGVSSAGVSLAAKRLGIEMAYRSAARRSERMRALHAEPAFRAAKRAGLSRHSDRVEAAWRVCLDAGMSAAQAAKARRRSLSAAYWAAEQYGFRWPRPRG